MEDDVKQAGADRYALSQAYRWKAERDVAMQELREIQARLMPDSGGCCEPGTYRCQEQAFTCDSCGHTVFVDKCMVDEISYLRAKGIRTLNCCCGHGGKVEPFIIVNEGDECRMLDMGYERHVNEYGATYFAPKSSCPQKFIAVDGKPLYFVTIRCPLELQDPNNKVLRKFADKYDNVGIIDWHGASEGHSEYLVDDGIHLTPDGADAFALLVRKALCGA